MMTEGSSDSLPGLSVVEKKVGQDEVGTPRSSMAGEDFVLVGEESPEGPRKVRPGVALWYLPCYPRRCILKPNIIQCCIPSLAYCIREISAGIKKN